MAPTMDKRAAEYQYVPKGTHSCATCEMFKPAGDRFQSAGSCTLVKGAISPHGWCKHWEKREEQRR